MQSFSEKLGIYELWGIFLPGFIFNSFIIIIYKILKNEQLEVTTINGFFETIFIFIFTYFVGLVIKNISSVIEKFFIYPKGKISEIFLTNNIYCSEFQRKMYHKMIIKELGDEFKSLDEQKGRFIYQYISTYNDNLKINEKSKVATSIYAMNKNLFTAFFILFIFTCTMQVYLYYYFNIFLSLRFFLIELTLGINGFLFLKRTKKYALYQVVDRYNIFFVAYKLRNNVQ